MDIGFLYDLRNPRRWFVPWDRYYGEALDHIAHMDDLGADVISFAEHHGDPEGANPAMIVTLTAAAMRTQRARIGPHILQLPFYHPVVLAEQLAMIDILSGGRLQVAVGPGGTGFDMEFDMLGVNPRQRPSRIEEGLEVLLRCWTESTPFDYHGKRWHLDGVEISPKPLQDPYPPVYLTAPFGQVPMERAARFGTHLCGPGGMNFGLTSKDMWMPWWRQWEQVAGQHRRDPESAKVVAFATCFVTDDPERAWARHRDGVLHHLNFERRGRHPFSEVMLGGAPERPEDIPGWENVFCTPEAAIAELQDCFADRAPDQLLLWGPRPGMTWDECAEFHEKFLTKVAPHVRNLGQFATAGTGQVS